jgi:ferredoxin
MPVRGFHELDPADPAARQRLLADACVRIEPGRCVQCGLCVYNCPIGIDVRGHARRAEPVYDRRCLTCGECVRRCTRDVLSFGARPGATP